MFCTFIHGRSVGQMVCVVLKCKQILERFINRAEKLKIIIENFEKIFKKSKQFLS